jgi:hypothetical protein
MNLYGNRGVVAIVSGYRVRLGSTFPLKANDKFLSPNKIMTAIM